jgi:hypothetical protein
MVKVYRSVRTNKFLVPDIYTVLIEFEPKTADPAYADDEDA